MSLRDEYIKAGIIKPQVKPPDPPPKLAAAAAAVTCKANLEKPDKPSKIKGKGKGKTPVQNKPGAPKNPPLRCVLCGELVQAGRMESHKIAMHGESATAPKAVINRFNPPKAVILRGGGTGLKG